MEQATNNKIPLDVGYFLINDDAKDFIVEYYNAENLRLESKKIDADINLSKFKRFIKENNILIKSPTQTYEEIIRIINTIRLLRHNKIHQKTVSSTNQCY